MQNVMRKFRQNSIVFEKPGILSENLNFDKLQLSCSLIFFAEISHTFSTYHCLKKGGWDFFYLYLDFELFAKIKKDLVSKHSVLTLLLITQDLNKIRKIPHTLL